MWLCHMVTTKVIGSGSIGKSLNPTFKMFILLKVYNSIYLILNKLYDKVIDFDLILLYAM